MKKNKVNVVKLEGTVVKCLPSNKYRVKLNDNKIILAYLCGNMIKNHIRLIQDDIVILELSTIDFSRGRIIFRK